MSPTKLAKSEKWFHGPEWLLLSEEQWPSTAADSESKSAAEEELRGSRAKTTVLLSTVSSLSVIIDCARFSSFERLLRVTAYVKRFIHNARGKDKMSGPLSTKELEQAETVWIREMQQTLDHSQLDKQLGLFQDDNRVLRCQGRLENADLPYTTRHPAVLPRSHHVTSLIIHHCHESVFHNGLNATLTEVRTRYWITKGRQTVKKELHNCAKCRRFQGQHYPIPSSPDLPEFRVQEEHAFSSVGVDFAGPLYAKSDCDCQPEMAKAWITLFTCSTSHAVHLELVPGMDTDTFLRCLKRFVGRRGIPRLIVSDNAKTFEKAERELTAIFDSPLIQDYLSGRRIDWQYNLAKAPWWGGFFKRLIKEVKLCLKKVLGRARLTFDELSTILVEIEAVLNSRPLTYLYLDEIEEPLTPSHLVIGRRLLTLPSRSEDEEAESSSAFTRWAA